MEDPRQMNLDAHLVQELMALRAEVQQLQMQQLQQQQQPQQRQPVLQTRNIVRLSYFTGTNPEEWINWRVSVESARRGNQWNFWQTLMAVRGHLTESAMAVARNLPLPEREDEATTEEDYNAYMNELERKFIPEGATALAHTRFEQARQEAKEGLLQWYTRVQWYYQQAFPDVHQPNAEDERRMVRRFTKGMRSQAIMVQLLRANPATMAAALTVAQNESSVMNSLSEELGNKAAGELLRVKVEPMEIGSMTTAGKMTSSTSSSGDAGNKVNALGGQGRGQGLTHGSKGRNPSRGPNRCHICQKEGHFKLQCPEIPEAVREGLRKAMSRGRGTRGQQGSARGSGRSRVSEIASNDNSTSTSSPAGNAQEGAQSEEDF